LRQLCSKSNNRCDERAATDRKPRPGQVWTAVATAATEQRLSAQNSRRQTLQQPKLVFNSCLLATRPWAATLIDMPKDLAHHHAGAEFAMNVVHVNLVIPMQTDQENIRLDFK